MTVISLHWEAFSLHWTVILPTTLYMFTGFYVICISFFTADNLTIPYHTAQIICCFFPPFALQLGCSSFLKSYKGISTSSICWIMVSAQTMQIYSWFNWQSKLLFLSHSLQVADIFIYTALAWYFSQVWPSKVGVAKPFYFTGNRTPTKQGRILPSGKSYPRFVVKRVKKIQFYPLWSGKVAKKKLG